MKYFVKIIVFFVIISCIYNGLIFFKERSEERKRIERRKSELERMRKVEEQRWQDMREKETADEEIKPYPPSMPAPESRRVISAPTPKSTVDHRHEVRIICERRQCKLLAYNEQGHAIYIEVAGANHSAVSDILPELIRAGVVNFTEHRDKFGVKMIDGKRMYFAAYTLRW